VAAVTEEVSRIDGVRSVEIELRPGDVSVVTVISDIPLLTEAVRDAIDEAGYALAG
jgi:copper chaperone CopZ